MRLAYVSKVFNEERILPYTLRHYDQYVERYFIWNHGSTDRTREICEANPKVTLFNLPAGPFDDSENAEIKNNAWKSHIHPDNYDFVILADCDEFLYHPDLIGLLTKYKEQGILIPRIEGYQMFAEEFPNTDGQIYDVVKRGRRALNYDKYIIINPAVTPNYSYGCHFINPTGNVTYSETAEIKLLHYKIFGVEFIKKMMDRNETFCAHNKLIGAGIYSLEPGARFNPKEEYELLKREAGEIL